LISGVAPHLLDGLYSDRPVDLWMLLEGKGANAARSEREMWIVARLRHGVSTGQGQTAVRRAFGSSGAASIVSFTGAAPGEAQGLSRLGTFLHISAIAVFSIACISVASFLLGRALRRSHETSLRVALGATRSRLVWELLSDSIVISVA